MFLLNGRPLHPVTTSEDIEYYSLEAIHFLSMGEGRKVTPYDFMDCIKRAGDAVHGTDYMHSTVGYLVCTRLAKGYADTIKAVLVESDEDSSHDEFMEHIMKACSLFSEMAYDLVLENEGRDDRESDLITPADVAKFANTIAGVAAINIGVMIGYGMYHGEVDGNTVLKNAVVLGSGDNIDSLTLQARVEAEPGDVVRFTLSSQKNEVDHDFVYEASHCLAEMAALCVDYDEESAYFHPMVEYAMKIREHTIEYWPIGPNSLESFVGTVAEVSEHLVTYCDIRLANGEHVADLHTVMRDGYVVEGEEREFLDFPDRVLGVWEMREPML